MIYIQNLKKNIADRNLFEIASLYINENDKCAFIGDNGSGKTTLLRIILGLDKDYSGDVKVDGSFGYLLNEEIDKDFYDEKLFRTELNFDDKYSPGEYQRLKLIDLLSDNFKFLLMDEPTSHLDIGQKEELIDRLRARKLGFLIISHDRDFINRTCNKVIELSDGKIDEYKGDYKFYLEERERRYKFQTSEYTSYIKEKRRLENVASNIKKQSSKIRTAPKRMGNSEARLHKMGGQGNKKKLDKQVKAIESRIDQLDIKEKPKEEKEVILSIPENEKIHSKILARAEKLSKDFNNKILFQDASFIIENNSKVALIGENGSGKTTLLKMILDKKDIWVNPNLKIGYFSQMSDILDQDKTILKNVLGTSIYDETITRIILARLGFKNDDSLKIVKVLSDGEKAKVKLAKILTSDFNFLIFDEPTNFLDIRSIEGFENLLKSYDRPFIFVTHDEDLINNIANTILLIKDKQISKFNGNLRDYKNSQKEDNKSISKDELLLEFRISSISSRLSMEISKEEREKLEEEYKDLISRKSNN